jgi:hypothetical protein
LSDWHYQTIHNSQWGQILPNIVMSGLVIGLSLVGVRRELFSRI